MPVQLTCVVCGSAFFVRPCRVLYGAKYCNYRCHQVGEGRKGGVVRGDQVKQLSQGKAYTKTNGRHTHRVVMEQMLGRSLKAGEVVHHKDRNKLNNAPDNLELLASRAEHSRLHAAEALAKRKAKHGY